MSLVYTADNRSRLYVGGRSDAKNRAKLEQWGVKYILNVTTAKEAGLQQSGVPNYFEKDRAFVYKRIPVYDTSTSASDLLAQADSIVDFISKGLLRGAVLVHCNMGQSRSTTAALFYLIRKANMTLPKALELIQRRRPSAEPIPAFWEILESYEAKCRKEREQEDGKSSNDKKRGPDNNIDDGGKEKRRKAVGPAIGPSIGPSIGPQIGPAIGPPIGPPIGPSSKKAFGPSQPSKKPPTIGPSMPPDAKAKKASIGPSLPPSSTKKKIGPSLPPPS